MAKLTQSESNSFEIGPLAPPGTCLATCLDVNDQFGVDRPKFENPQETETLDVTRFLFGFIGQDTQPYKVQSFEFRISGSPKNNLFKFLTTWFGHPPKYGWGYCEMKGQGAMLTVAHKPSRDGSKIYANLVGIPPVIAQLRDQFPPLSAFPDVVSDHASRPPPQTAATAFNQPASTPSGYPAQALQTQAVPQQSAVAPANQPAVSNPPSQNHPQFAQQQ